MNNIKDSNIKWMLRDAINLMIYIHSVLKREKKFNINLITNYSVSLIKEAIKKMFIHFDKCRYKYR